jgi:type VI secretion system secreted protein Hcp
MAIDMFMVLPSTVSSGVGTMTITADPTLDAYFKSTFGTQPVVELRSFSLGVETTTTIASATTGAGAGKMMFNEASFEKPVDLLSPSLYQLSARGARLDRLQVFIRKPGADTIDPRPYLVYGFSFVLLAKIDWSVSEGDAQPTEQVIFRYGQLGLAYYPQKLDGTFGTLKRASWDQLANRETVSPDVFAGV